jgi:geranylgeranyl diphosphate synthase type I
MRFNEIMEEYKKKADKEIELFLDKEMKGKKGFLEDSYKIIKKYLAAGGKRIRPIAAVMAFEALSGENKKIFLPAIGIEFLHNSTLCHDDIMDEDSARRGSPSCHKKFQAYFSDNFPEKNYKGDIFSKESMRFGVSQAIIAGNILNYLGYKCFTESKFSDEIKNRAINKITEVMININHGQILDIAYEKKDEVSEKEYFEMIGKKTAYLLGAAFELGAVFAEADAATSERFFNYGFNLGIAFQIIDDLMDADSEMAKGHELGSDVKKGKKTLILIKALELAKNADKRFIIEAFGKENKTDEEVRRIIRIFNACGAVEHARRIALERAENAKRIISQL